MKMERKPIPGPEAIRWDGANEADLVDLVKQVADLKVWTPLHGAPITHVVNPEHQLHPGLNILAGDVIVARVEKGNWLVFDPFAETPLFAMVPNDFDELYGTAD